jgi:hypothetical protein
MLEQLFVLLPVDLFNEPLLVLFECLDSLTRGSAGSATVC